MIYTESCAILIIIYTYCVEKLADDNRERLLLQVSWQELVESTNFTGPKTTRIGSISGRRYVFCVRIIQRLDLSIVFSEQNK